MIWRRIVAVSVLTLGVAAAFFVGLLGLFGDCPEKVIYHWPGGTACSDHKRLIARFMLIGLPLLWLVGTVAIFRFRRR